MSLLKTLKIGMVAVMCSACIAGAVSAQYVDDTIAYPAPGAYPPAGAGYIFYAESFLQVNDPALYDPGDYAPEPYFYWEIRNYSTDLQITGWTWAGGDVLEIGKLGESSNPFPLGNPSGGIPKLAFADLDSLVDTEMYWPSDDPRWNPIQVESTIHFSDGYTATMNIFVPQGVVPEPGSLVALSAGMTSLLALLRRKR